MAMVSSSALGLDPKNISCPYCHEQILTKVKREQTASTHAWALCLCFFFPPLACIPYCADSCRDSNHYCPSCQAFLGTYGET